MQQALSSYELEQLGQFKRVLEAFLEIVIHENFAPFRNTLVVASETDRARLFKRADYRGVEELYCKYLAAAETVIDVVCRRIRMTDVEIDHITIYENRGFELRPIFALMVRGFDCFEAMAWSILARVEAQIAICAEGWDV